jgi:hypothetical protein
MVVRMGVFGEDGYLGWIMEYICMRILYSKRKCDHIEVKEDVHRLQYGQRGSAAKSGGWRRAARPVQNRAVTSRLAVPANKISLPTRDPTSVVSTPPESAACSCELASVFSAFCSAHKHSRSGSAAKEFDAGTPLCHRRPTAIALHPLLRSPPNRQAGSSGLHASFCIGCSSPQPSFAARRPTFHAPRRPGTLLVQARKVSNHTVARS